MAQIISVFDKDETSFTSNGYTLPDVVSCEIEEVLNGRYTLELTHPIDEKGKWEKLVEENVIKADGQLFRINRSYKDLEYITVYARHIFYDLRSNFLEDVRPTNLNGAGAIDWVLSGTQYPHPFISTSDITSLSTAYFIRKNPIDAILGPDGVCERWSGELERDNFQVRLWESRGEDKGAHIAYGKNMIGIEVDTNYDDVVTRIYPVGNNELTLPEKYVDSPLINNYAFPRIKTIPLDIGVDEDTTEEQAYQLMRDKCAELYSVNKLDLPYESIMADLVLLENTEEYKNFSNLIKVELGDTVGCTDNPLNVTFSAKVVRVRKDVLTDRNIEIELGQIKRSYTNTLETVIRDISYELVNTKSDFQQAIENATDLLTSALGGYVLKRAGELLIMDTEDPTTATKVWRWNLNGLGYSSNGIDGPYELAMTIDGVINADFITAGTVSANLVKAGILASNDNNAYFDLNNAIIRVGHGGTQYSQLDVNGLFRQWENGSGAYLNDIYIEAGYSVVTNILNPPPDVWISLPSRFKNRPNTQLFAIPTDVYTPVSAEITGEAPEHLFICRVNTRDYTIDWTAENVQVPVRAYTRVRTDYRDIITNHYGEVEFILLAIGA